MLFIVHDNEMLCCIRHSFSNMVHAWNHLPFVTYPDFFLKLIFQLLRVEMSGKRNHWCLLNRLGSNVKPDSAFTQLYCVSAFFWSLVSCRGEAGWPVSWRLSVPGTEPSPLWHGEAAGKGLPSGTCFPQCPMSSGLVLIPSCLLILLRLPTT